MKNIYNQIEQNLKAGLNVVVQDLEDNTYCVIGTNKDDDGNYRCSNWRNSIENAKQWIGESYGNIEDYWNEQDLEIVEVFRPEYEPFKVGDKVRILDTIKKAEDWGKLREDFPDMTGEIKEVFVSVDGTNYLINDWFIGHEYLAPLVEQEVEELTMEEVCKLLGREVKIKK